MNELISGSKLFFFIFYFLSLVSLFIGICNV